MAFVAGRLVGFLCRARRKQSSASLKLLVLRYSVDWARVWCSGEVLWSLRQSQAVASRDITPRTTKIFFAIRFMGSKRGRRMAGVPAKAAEEKPTREGR